jgi:hypothetical protein
MDIKLLVTPKEIIPELKKLSTESLIIWIVGTSERLNIKLPIEQIALECWLINPDKHSLRGYPQFPDSFVVMKRIYDMKGRKGLIAGSSDGGFKLTQLSGERYAELEKNIKSKKTPSLNSKNAADRTITSIDEAPYKRLTRTTAYQKFKENKTEQIVESDFLYFYGINWHSKKAFVEGKIRNIDLVIDKFSSKDPLLKKVRDFLNDKFQPTKNTLIK